MKKIQSISLAVAIGLTLIVISCKKSLVETTAKGVFLADNYYKDQSQAFAGLVATYDVLRKNSGGFDNMITFMNAGSDDQYAGGGGESDGAGIQSFSKHTISADLIPGSFWGDHYQGIFRANTLLDKITNTVMDETLKQRYIAEAKGLRGIYYFNLVRLFKNVPLILKPVSATDIYNIKQSSSDSVYAQIEKDLSDAKAVLPPIIKVQYRLCWVRFIYMKRNTHNLLPNFRM
jgi:hypothetical protein